MATLDPDALKQFQFLVFTKLEGAVTAGMIHLGDQLGLYRALADAAGPLTSAELAARTGLDERWVREWAFNQAAATHPRRAPRRSASGSPLSAEGGRRPGLARPRGVRRGHVPRPAADAGGLERLPRELPQRRSASTTTATARSRRGRHGAQLRAVEPGPPAADRAADARRRRRQAGVGGHGRRRRLRRGRRRAAAGRRVPRQPVRRLRHLPARPRPGAAPASPSRGWRTPRSTTPASTRCRPITPSTSSRRSTASTT